MLFPHSVNYACIYFLTRTVTFGEHKCFGESANYTMRVAYGKQLTDAEAAKFTDISFIDGQQWLNQSDISL